MTLKFPELNKDLDIAAMEERARELWDKTRIYDYDPKSKKPLFSVDTPPPYVSAAHLHVGHSMSYTQAEIVVRYKRMRGFNVFYPMGFDDNGLPTERYVEQKHKINKSKITRGDFRALCLKETQEGAKVYEEFWRALGLSVDWSLRYSTIDDLSRHTSQKSFLDLYKKGLIYRSAEPVLWDTHFETALAQADLETMDRKGMMYDVQFKMESGEPLIISTTRPEMIYACVGLFFNPEDDRYQKLKGKKAIVPLSGHAVPILSSEDVDKTFGTGLMMVCTFGDGEDVKKWKLHKLDTRLTISENGHMTEAAGPYAGLTVEQARKKIALDLTEAGIIVGHKSVEQSVSVGERSGVPVEFTMRPQWFVNLLDHKEEFLKRSDALRWFPDWMKVRLEHWVNGLKYNWNLSRQRFYGVPFPLWYVQETGEVILADEADLPVDPIEHSPPAWAKEKYKGKTIVPETDVMETWMTSSLTPLINANWVGRKGWKGSMDIYPMSLRIQGFEIIRTWLFYTLAKSHFHTNSLPWKDVMISGWGLNEQGRKIAKRDLEQFTDATGFNRYEPYSLIKKYGADAIRYWAASGQLGQDLRYQERDVKDGRKVVVKLWNVARLCFTYLKGFDPKRDSVPFAERPTEDRWLLSRLNDLISNMTGCFEQYDYATAREHLHKFFWMAYCDDYLELVKSRFWEDSAWTDKDRKAAQCTMYESLRIVLGLFAPYLPYITEEIYQQAGMFGEDAASIHTSNWPAVNATWRVEDGRAMDVILNTLYAVRKMRSDMKIGSGTMVEQLVMGFEHEAKELLQVARGLTPSLLGAARASRVVFEGARNPTNLPGLSVDVVPYPEGKAPEIKVRGME